MLLLASDASLKRERMNVRELGQSKFHPTALEEVASRLGTKIGPHAAVGQ
jgi:hypothetical protein